MFCRLLNFALHLPLSRDDSDGMYLSSLKYNIWSQNIDLIKIYSFFLRIRPIGLFQLRITSEFINHRQTLGLLERVISSSQVLYLHRTTQHRQRRTNIHVLSGIRTRDPVYERSRPGPQRSIVYNSKISRCGAGPTFKEIHLNS
jgi:hypothetical protein